MASGLTHASTSLIAFFIAIPILLAIYTFLIFPNLDVFMQGVHWYTYNQDSQHILYWLGFWVIVLFGSISRSK